MSALAFLFPGCEIDSVRVGGRKMMALPHLWRSRCMKSLITSAAHVCCLELRCLRSQPLSNSTNLAEEPFFRGHSIWSNSVVF